VRRAIARACPADEPCCGAPLHNHVDQAIAGGGK